MCVTYQHVKSVWSSQKCTKIGCVIFAMILSLHLFGLFNSMRRRFETYDALVAFSERTGTRYRRVSIHRYWTRWRNGAKGHAKTCCHEGAVVEWSCDCSFGCDCCRFRAECTECNSKFVSKTDAPMSVTVHLAQ